MPSCNGRARRMHIWTAPQDLPKHMPLATDMRHHRTSLDNPESAPLTDQQNLVPDINVEAIIAALRAYVADLRRNAEALSDQEPPTSSNAIYAEAYAGCARDLERIMAGSLTAEDLLV
jgi:hypothetical protein